MGTGIGDFFPNRGIGDMDGSRDKYLTRDGANYVPVSVSVPTHALIFHSVPVLVPIGDGDFSPLRDGAPTGIGIP